ncbi:MULTISPECIES: Hint domain-containing protein [unclassified Ruegeria]|uniref:Hint domain-containing protein n=1 Tax=unclassified Ruegeria TaxID=2625375 RepID=UPI001487F738|nr:MULTISPECIES: Hint domain-containing protein [unclassified Ruegeria]NOD64366.1 calcium-binding protein [Ruegeria sp. HKCCD6109]
MANYSYIGYVPGVISLNFTGFNTGNITLSGTYDAATDRRVFDVTDAAGGTLVNGAPDNGTDFNGDRFNNEFGDDLTQTGVVTNLDGSVTIDTGAIYLEESYSLSKPGGGTIDVFRVEVEGNLVGYITSEPLVAGTTYSFVRSNVTPTNAPDTSDPTAIIDVPCFVAGTRITTPDGPVSIEDLHVGDFVVTADNGPQEIRWIGSRVLDATDLAARPKLLPIRIAAGSLGKGLPERDLLVSPQHRMMLRSPIAVRMFDSAEVLVPAHKLVGIPGINVDVMAQDVVYFHILFDQHEIIYSEGAPSESLFTGAQAMASIHSDARAEILELFPELAQPNYIPQPARQIPDKGRRARALVSRHIKNERPLISEC